MSACSNEERAFYESLPGARGPRDTERCQAVVAMNSGVPQNDTMRASIWT